MRAVTEARGRPEGGQRRPKLNCVHGVPRQAAGFSRRYRRPSPPKGPKVGRLDLARGEVNNGRRLYSCTPCGVPILATGAAGDVCAGGARGAFVASATSGNVAVRAWPGDGASKR
jgi:hypothetical protein